MKKNEEDQADNPWRFFTKEDRSGSLPVTIVNQEFARRFFAGADPVGKHLSFAPGTNLPELDFAVIGVVGDVRYIGLDRQSVPVRRALLRDVINAFRRSSLSGQSSRFP